MSSANLRFQASTKEGLWMILVVDFIEIGPAHGPICARRSQPRHERDNFLNSVPHLRSSVQLCLSAAKPLINLADVVVQLSVALFAPFDVVLHIYYNFTGCTSRTPHNLIQRWWSRAYRLSSLSSDLIQTLYVPSSEIRSTSHSKCELRCS